MKTCVQRGVTYDAHGDHGPAVLFIHPAYTDARAWRDTVVALADYRCIVIDLPGHGRTVSSAAGEDPPPSLASTQDILAEILDVEGIDAVHVVGSSLGSLVAQDFVLSHPSRARSLFVIGGYAVWDAEMASAQQWEILRWLPRLIFSLPAFRRYVVNTSTHTERGAAAFAEMVEDFTRSRFLLLRGMGDLLDPERTEPSACPRCITVGEHDLPSSVEAARRWHRAVPGSQLHVFQGLGHCAHLDDPDAFNPVLAAFLDRTDAAQSA